MQDEIMLLEDNPNFNKLILDYKHFVEDWEKFQNSWEVFKKTWTDYQNLVVGMDPEKVAQFTYVTEILNKSLPHLSEENKT